MPKSTETKTAESFLPERRSLTALRRAATDCRACPLYRNATQTVFGTGAARARLMIVGETPGDREDLEGKPFVGPAGKLLDEALEAAGIGRRDAYVTNAVKHFKWEPQGKRRLHKKPNAAEERACRPWLDAEIDTIQPTVILCLGATAAQALLGKKFRITTARGAVQPSPQCDQTIATYHPAAVLRAPDHEARERMRAELFEDVRRAVELADTTTRTGLVPSPRRTTARSRARRIRGEG